LAGFAQLTVIVLAGIVGPLLSSSGRIAIPVVASLKATAEDDDERQKGWLKAADEVMVELMQRDHREWREAVSNSHPLR